MGHGGVGFSFLAEKSLDVSTIFLEQGMRAVFRMSLEVDEQAVLFSLYERIDPGFRRFGQHNVTAGSQRILTHFVPTGMRKMNQVACVFGHHVVSGFIESEDAKTLVIQPVSTNAIA